MRATGIRAVGVLAAFGALISCAVGQAHRLDRRYGEAVVREREVQDLPTGAIDYWSRVRPIFEARCVVCHACYDAPCQLKLGSTEGIDRGASKDKVYDALRLTQAPLTRLFEDARNTKQWRAKEFHPVLNERGDTPRANREASLMARLLELKRAHPVAAGELLPQDVDLTLQREDECPTIEELPRHMRDHPQWGMPYGLPALSETEHATLVQWLEEGAVHVAPPPLTSDLAGQVARWEAFLNGDSPKARLASRYVYEHLFLAHIYFGKHTADKDPPQFFELVRSRTPPGVPVDRIATRRPYDDPGVARPYYRLQPVREAIVAKLHLPYRFDEARMRRWSELLYDADYEVTTLPSYTPKVASNPFVSFRAIPVSSRYRFMLDESEFTFMGFIKGAVCRGPIALNVIDDHFWVLFIDPDVNSKLHDAKFLFRNADALRMPAASGSTAAPALTWARHAVLQRKFMKAKRRVISAEFGGTRKLTREMLWDGDGTNPNAALTVFRHHDSASVVRGLVGEEPKTTWVVGYPLLERIHYLLVAGFDVYGNVGHQLATRTYMDFLRMEAEFEFLAFLPQDARRKERDFWYRGTTQPIYREVIGQVDELEVETGIRYTTNKPKLELYGMLREAYAPVNEGRYALEGISPDIAGPLRALAHTRGLPVSHLPPLAFVFIPDGPPGAQAFTLIHNAMHRNISSPLSEDERRIPGEDTLTVARGILGAYPNAFYVVPRAHLRVFVDRIAALKNESDYAGLQRTFGVRRTDPEFWTMSDRLHALYRAAEPVESGLFDLSRIENR